jgi:DNA-binding NtrC family response regulator
VVDPDEAIRRSAHHLLGCQGASVETAHDGHEAIALMRQTPYSAALVDIRLPDLDGYEAFKRLREVQPNVPIILMTGFGWDPSHSIVKARQEGLETVLYKPFRADRLMDAVEQALRSSSGPRSFPSPQADATPPTVADEVSPSAMVSRGQSADTSSLDHSPQVPPARSADHAPPDGLPPQRIPSTEAADSQPIETAQHDS